MMNRILVSTLLAVLLTAPAAAAADPDWFDNSDDTPGRSSCVTKSEEKSLPGMTHGQVEDYLGWEGYAADLYKGSAREYRPCGYSWREGRVTVRFGKAGRVWFPVRLISPGGILDLPSEHPGA